jgi:hypothetical protein
MLQYVKMTGLYVNILLWEIVASVLYHIHWNTHDSLLIDMSKFRPTNIGLGPVTE